MRRFGCLLLVRRHMRSGGELRDEAFFRVGAAVLGLLAGFVMGALLFTPLALASLVSTPLKTLLIASAVAGAVCGAALPGTAVVAFEGVVHTICGALGALFGGELPSLQDAPRWLSAAFWVGALYLGGVWLCLAAYSLFTRYPP